MLLWFKNFVGYGTVLKLYGHVCYCKVLLLIFGAFLAILR